MYLRPNFEFYLPKNPSLCLSKTPLLMVGEELERYDYFLISFPAGWFRYIICNTLYVQYCYLLARTRIRVPAPRKLASTLACPHTAIQTAACTVACAERAGKYHDVPMQRSHAVLLLQLLLLLSSPLAALSLHALAIPSWFYYSLSPLSQFHSVPSGGLCLCSLQLAPL